MKTIHILILIVVMQLGNLYAGKRPLSPVENCQFKSLTSHRELLDYVSKLDHSSKFIEIEIVGRSVLGRDIPAIFLSKGKFGRTRTQKAIVLIIAQQHGNEPSGKEAALVAAGRIVHEKSGLLDHLDIVVVPQVNPDGAEKGKRRNANDIDLNRDHVLLREPETRGLHDLFTRLMPDVVLDVHEYNAVTSIWVKKGMTKNADVMLGALTNLNIPAEIIKFSRETIIKQVGKKLNNEGWIFHEYVVGDPFATNRMRYNTVGINDARQSTGLYNTLSFIQEGKRYGDIDNLIQRRVVSQEKGILSFLNTVADHWKKITSLIRQYRGPSYVSAKIKQPVFIQMDYFHDDKIPPPAFPFFDLYTWRGVWKKLKRFDGLVKIKKSTVSPSAYLIPQKEKKIIQLLGRHSFEIHKLKADVSLAVEAYKFKHITSRWEEELQLPQIDLETERITKRFKRGDRLISLQQPGFQFIPLILEPQSSWGILSYTSEENDYFKAYLQMEPRYPVYRLMDIPAGISE